MSETARSRRPYAARVPIDVRREQLLDAALAVIVRDGYDRISIDAIARQAGVTRPVVYGAYAGLRPLLGALLDRQQARALEQLTAALPDFGDLGDLDEAVGGTVRRLVDMVAADPDTWRTVLFAHRDAPVEVRERVTEDWERVRARLEELVGLGLTLAGIQGYDGELLSHGMLAVMEHFGRVLLDEPDRFDADRFVATLTGLLHLLQR